MPSGTVPPEPAPGPLLGKVVHVNRSSGYVIVHGRDLPNEGTEATLRREGWDVGRIRFAGPRKEPFAAADILSGQPMVEDRWALSAPYAADEPSR
jgi:hypothetical protein